MSPREKAELLVVSIVQALARGVKHYNRAGEELKTPRAIIDCLLNEDSITVEEPPHDCPDPWIGCSTCSKTH